MTTPPPADHLVVDYILRGAVYVAFLVGGWCAGRWRARR